jgi:protein involved in polysaccharide export with SLBB domain
MRVFGISCLFLVLTLGVGCVSFPGADDGFHRMAPYRPVSDTIVLVKPDPMAEQKGETNSVIATASSDGGTSAAGDGSDAEPVQRILSRGDRVMISLRGIPRAEELKNVIDGTGHVTLPFIGQVLVAGLSPSDAERLIESKYIDGEYYRSINVIVVAEDKVYFVQGEVARQGKFSMSGDVTLLQAITEAGGYSPFANRKNVKVIRGDQVLFFNARDIADGENVDPAILADDIIVVQRSVF